MHLAVASHESSATVRGDHSGCGCDPGPLAAWVSLDTAQSGVCVQKLAPPKKHLDDRLVAIVVMAHCNSISWSCSASTVDAIEYVADLTASVGS